jgi:hypothetical protein
LSAKEGGDGEGPRVETDSGGRYELVVSSGDVVEAAAGHIVVKPACWMAGERVTVGIAKRSDAIELEDAVLPPRVDVSVSVEVDPDLASTLASFGIDRCQVLATEAVRGGLPTSGTRTEVKLEDRRNAGILHVCETVATTTPLRPDSGLTPAKRSINSKVWKNLRASTSRPTAERAIRLTKWSTICHKTG